MAIIIRNVSIYQIILDNAGLVLDPSESVDIINAGYSHEELSNDTDLVNKISAGTVVVNDGMVDLSVSDGLKHIQIQTRLEDEPEDYYGAGGDGTSTFTFVTAIGIPNDSTGAIGSIYVDSVTGNYYQKDIGSWTFQGKFFLGDDSVENKRIRKHCTAMSVVFGGK